MKTNDVKDIPNDVITPASAVHSVKYLKLGRKLGEPPACSRFASSAWGHVRKGDAEPYPQSKASQIDDPEDQQGGHRDERCDIIDIVREENYLGENVSGYDGINRIVGLFCPLLERLKARP